MVNRQWTRHFCDFELRTCLNKVPNTSRTNAFCLFGMRLLDSCNLFDTCKCKGCDVNSSERLSGDATQFVVDKTCIYSTIVQSLWKVNYMIAWCKTPLRSTKQLWPSSIETGWQIVWLLTWMKKSVVYDQICVDIALNLSCPHFMQRCARQLSISSSYSLDESKSGTTGSLNRKDYKDDWPHTVHAAELF